MASSILRKDVPAVLGTWTNSSGGPGGLGNRESRLLDLNVRRKTGRRLTKSSSERHEAGRWQRFSASFRRRLERACRTDAEHSARGARIAETTHSPCFPSRCRVARAHALGAYECLPEGVSITELARAIRSAAVGKPPVRSRENQRIVADLMAWETQDGPTAKLTPREQQILRHIAFGLSNDEIARSLGIMLDTVKEHVETLLRSLAVKDRTHAAVWAIKNDLG